MTKSVEYTPVFRGAIDEEPAVEHIDLTWMEETAPAEYGNSRDEHSEYLGCTFKEYALNAIYDRAMVWLMREGGDADTWATNQWMRTSNSDFVADLIGFFASVQAKVYCDALHDGKDGRQAIEAASKIVGMVANSYIDHVAEWNEDIEG